MHAPRVEGNFTQESGQAMKPRVVEDNNAYMAFVDKSDRMVNNCRQNMEVGQETVFSADRHCQSKRISYTQVVWRQNDAQKFRELVIHSQDENVAFQATDQVQLRCRVCSLHKQTRGTLYFSRKCDGGLCVANCSEKWPMRVNLVTSTHQLL
jgi:hypothetical protein